MTELLQPFLCKFVFFSDDILIYSINEGKHEKHLKIVLQTFKEAKLVPTGKNAVLVARSLNT